MRLILALRWGTSNVVTRTLLLVMTVVWLCLTLACSRVLVWEQPWSCGIYGCHANFATATLSSFPTRWFSGNTSVPFLSPGPYLRPLLTLRWDALGVVARWSSLAICRLLANAVSVRLVGTRPDQRHLALLVMGVWLVGHPPSLVSCYCTKPAVCASNWRLKKVSFITILLLSTSFDFFQLLSTSFNFFPLLSTSCCNSTGSRV